MKTLYEKYRPQDFSEVLGQSKAVNRIQAVLKNGWGGQAFWISGASGTGKSTLAKIIARQGADPFFITEYDSADALTVAEIDNIDRTMHLFGWGKGGRCILINESHGLRKQIIRRLLGLLERIPNHFVWIFTTTKVGQAGLFEEQIDAGPLLSRCVYIELTNQGLAQVFAEHCRQIATKENLNGKTLQSYVKLAQNCKNNCRQMLMAVESGEMLE